jgi:hypothetical protein
MYLINSIKKFLKIKEVPRIESIKTYEDVNLFLKGYKNYFKLNWTDFFDNRVWVFAFISNGQKITIIKSPYNTTYQISDGVSTYRELYIRAFIYDHKDEINERLLIKQQIQIIKQQIQSETEKEFLRRKTLEEQIKNTGGSKNV